ncbi:MAG: hypothetical protein ACREFD_05195 [Stellaceae bacterium]
MSQTDAHRHDVVMGTAPKMAERLSTLDGLLRQALLALGAAGETDRACPIAAAAWSSLRHEMPREAERYNGLLHRLTATKHRQRNDSP